MLKSTDATKAHCRAHYGHSPRLTHEAAESYALSRSMLHTRAAKAAPRPSVAPETRICHAVKPALFYRHIVDLHAYRHRVGHDKPENYTLLFCF